MLMVTTLSSTALASESIYRVKERNKQKESGRRHPVLMHCKQVTVGRADQETQQKAMVTNKKLNKIDRYKKNEKK